MCSLLSCWDYNLTTIELPHQILISFKHILQPWNGQFIQCWMLNFVCVHFNIFWHVLEWPFYTFSGISCKSRNFSFNCVHLDTRVKSAYKVSSVYCIKCKLQFVRLCPAHIGRCISKMFYKVYCDKQCMRCIVKAFGWFLVFALSIGFLLYSFPWVQKGERNSSILYTNISCLFYLHCVNCMKLLILIFTTAYIARNILFAVCILFVCLVTIYYCNGKMRNGKIIFFFNFML